MRKRMRRLCLDVERLEQREMLAGEAIVEPLHAAADVAAETTLAIVEPENARAGGISEVGGRIQNAYYHTISPNAEKLDAVFSDILEDHSRGSDSSELVSDMNSIPAESAIQNLQGEQTGDPTRDDGPT